MNMTILLCTAVIEVVIFAVHKYKLSHVVPPVVTSTSTPAP